MITLKQVQEHIGVTADGIWGNQTALAIMALKPVAAPPSTMKPRKPDAADLVTVDVLKAACPERSEAQLAEWVEPIKAACRKYDILTIRRIGTYIAQMAHESHLIPGREEDLRYSAKRLAQVWPDRYAINPKAKVADRWPTAKATTLAALGPQAIANDVYANRMGNGPPESGDGWKHRGAGPGQITGADNWNALARELGISVEAALTFGRTIAGGCMAFAWFWKTNGINKQADTPGVEDETRKVNGGQNGVDDRRARTNRAIAALLEEEKKTK